MGPAPPSPPQWLLEKEGFRQERDFGEGPRGTLEMEVRAGILEVKATPWRRRGAEGPPRKGLVPEPQGKRRVQADEGRLGVTAVTPPPRPPATPAPTCLLLISHLPAGARGLTLALSLGGPERSAEGKPWPKRDKRCCAPSPGGTAGDTPSPPPPAKDTALHTWGKTKRVQTSLGVRCPPVSRKQVLG